MIVQCQNCRTKFRLPDEKIPSQGTFLRCSKCGETFWFTPPKLATSPPMSQPLPTADLPAVEGEQSEATGGQGAESSRQSGTGDLSFFSIKDSSTSLHGDDSEEIVEHTLGDYTPPSKLLSEEGKGSQKGEVFKKTSFFEELFSQVSSPPEGEVPSSPPPQSPPSQPKGEIPPSPSPQSPPSQLNGLNLPESFGESDINYSSVSIDGLWEFSKDEGDRDASPFQAKPKTTDSFSELPDLAEEVTKKFQKSESLEALLFPKDEAIEESEEKERDGSESSSTDSDGDLSALFGKGPETPDLESLSLELPESNFDLSDLLKKESQPKKKRILPELKPNKRELSPEEPEERGSSEDVGGDLPHPLPPPLQNTNLSGATGRAASEFLLKDTSRAKIEFLLNSIPFLIKFAFTALTLYLTLGIFSSYGGKGFSLKEFELERILSNFVFQKWDWEVREFRYRWILLPREKYLLVVRGKIVNRSGEKKRGLKLALIAELPGREKRKVKEIICCENYSARQLKNIEKGFGIGEPKRDRRPLKPGEERDFTILWKTKEIPLYIAVVPREKGPKEKKKVPNRAK